MRRTDDGLTPSDGRSEFGLGSSPARSPVHGSLSSTESGQRSPSRLTTSIKNFLSRSSLSVPSDSDLSFHSFQVPSATGNSKWSMTSRRSRPPNLVISGPLAAAATPSSPLTPSDAHRRYASEATPTISIPNSDRFEPTFAPTRDPKTRNVLRRRPSGSVKLFKARDWSMSSPSRSDPPPKQPCALTPAGAVVQAYKHHDLHLDDLSPPVLSHMSPRASNDDGYDLSPCCFASSSEQQHQLTWNRASPSHHQSASDPNTHSITRRVSNKWRKSKDGSPAHERGHAKGRPSLQEIWKSGARSSGRDSTGDNIWSSPIVDHSRSGSESQGGKVWRLMRRISTGGLRDRFQSSDKIVPPVPAIPKDLLEKGNNGEHSNEPVSMQRHQSSSSPPSKNETVRPSVVIASSSSNSSDVASTQFFHKTHSSRSSVSSFGEAVSASHIPEMAALHQHIIAPLEQLRLGEDHAKSDSPNASSAPIPRSPRRSASVPAGLKTAEDPEGPRRESPSSAPASATVVDGIVSLSPPPRSLRNSRRGESMANSMLVGRVEGSVGQLDRTSSAQSDLTARADSLEWELGSPTRTGVTFRELGAPRRPPLSEREKVDIWNELLDRSDKAGGTLHINGEAELMSDNMRFSTHSET